MARIDLKSSSGFPFIYDGDSLKADNFNFEEITVSIDDMRNQLLNKDLNCPVVFYQKFIGIDTDGLYKSKKLQVNLYVISPNLAGIEYVKTRAIVNEKYPKILEVVHGGGTLLMQYYHSPRDHKIIQTDLKKGQKIIIPAGYAFSIINSMQTANLIVTEYQSIKASSEITLDDSDGMAYYIIRKNAKQEIVRNPNYKIAKEPETVNWNKVTASHGITPKTPIIKQIIRKYEKFDWLFKKNSITL